MVVERKEVGPGRYRESYGRYFEDFQIGDIYEHRPGRTITEAVSSGLPTIVTFSTPGFCQTATCGPQLDVVTRLKNRHRGNANFIHVEVFDNPNEMVGNFDVGRVSKIMGEWGLSSEPWTFVLDRFGRVAWKFEAFVTEAELESALKTTFGS